MHPNHESISKLSAASRLHDFALELWFQESEPLAVHVVAASAHQIIHDMNSASGGEDLLYDTLNIKDEFRVEYINWVKKPYNFLKHADRDASDKLDFSAEAVLQYFIFNMKGLKQLGQEFSQLSGLFCLWLGIHYPSWLKSIERFRETWKTTSDMEEYLRRMGRSEFFRQSISAHPSHSL